MKHNCSTPSSMQVEKVLTTTNEAPLFHAVVHDISSCAECRLERYTSHRDDVSESIFEFDTVKGDQGSLRPDAVPLTSIPSGN